MEVGKQQQYYLKDANSIFMKEHAFSKSEQEDENSSISTRSYEMKVTKLWGQNYNNKCVKTQTIIKINGEAFSESIEENENINKHNQYTLKTNNLIKNILKQFYKFLIKKQNIQLVSEFIFEKPAPYSIKLVKKYFDKFNYNNFSLIKIIKHQNYGRGFEYFLTFEALDVLQSSKVKNMQQHIDCIQYLKECCVNQEQINEINFYKKNKCFQF
ncbi:hypothetical protein TTHERM_000158529 (macronuclear) [Tetrahymena thermophila SB210]|uniref:Uncharacterized protein n=1 Tax=Tetrahymena thermophila (strain SB210) TaxID=312017 RepID=W7X998_TETTS|nr:hypothetical protein TTHERM_000158529 [Tetrahymena thermophila SB210]EWS75970.1 hypothetical protein TTHERM_000158529 [Tetrahymena thermophila SB210]|eukprot:XP_012651488.1 hypothetical protein TTHERM_000158529 [Tetrahymena thermophila SB210]